MEIAHLYKITNKLTGDYYIGKHNGWKQNGYWGSGNRIKWSIEKYGEENFEYQILVYGSPEFILELEEKYVTVELIESDEKCLNLCAGGLGVGRITEETRKKLSLVTSGKNNGMYGKKHSKETKQKIIEALKGKSLKEETKKLLSKITSNQIWVNNGVVNKRIKENELKYFIENGYQKGRIQFSTDLKQKISKGVSKLIWVNNGSKSYRISAENSNDFLEKGFVKGRGKIKFIKEIVNG